MENVPGTLLGCLHLLFDKGLRYSTVIDLGCADGHFFLELYCRGIFAGARGVNIDANPLYETSLRAIKEATGAHYVIAAASDSDGEAEMVNAAHPYWASLRPEGDVYWEQMNGLSAGKVRVPTIALDTLRKQLDLSPPFLLKLDVQGGEAAALRGARQMLTETEIVMCETDLRDLPGIHRILEDAGFDLFDLTEVNRFEDGSLGWFYPVYLNRRHAGVRPRSFWDAQFNARVIQNQKDRRQAVLARNAAALEWLKTQGPR